MERDTISFQGWDIKLFPLLSYRHMNIGWYWKQRATSTEGLVCKFTLYY